MIVVLGRPGLTGDGRLARASGRIALAAAQAGGRVELVGSVGDDADGEKVALALGVAGIGHAALLRDPGGVTPRVDSDGGETGAPLARLDRDDIDLGLRYLPFCRVLVAAEPLEPRALFAAVDAATYHRAALIVLIPAGAAPPATLPDDTTVLELPAEDEGAFADLVGRYAARLAAGEAAVDAWRGAVEQTGWEPAAEASAEPSPTGA